MSNLLFKKVKIYTFVNILISELSTDIDNIILNKIKNKYESKCTKYGLIKKNSIKIISRSSGISKNEHFNSSYYYYAICIADICNPPNDSYLNCKIIASNNAGYKAIVNDIDTNEKIIEIMIPKITTGIIHDINIDNLKENDEITIKICGKRLYYKENYITIIGSVSNNKFIENNNIQIQIENNDIQINNTIENDILINDPLLDLQDEDEKNSLKDFDDKIKLDDDDDDDDENKDDDEDENNEEDDDDFDDNIEAKDDFDQDDDDI
jgi:hypothetical protein